MSSYDLTTSLADAWGDRYLLEITLTNTGDAPLEGAVFDVYLDGAIDHLWRADWEAVGAGHYRVAMDRTLAPGESRVIGLTVDGDPEAEIGLVPLAGATEPTATEPAATDDPKEPSTVEDPVTTVGSDDPASAAAVLDVSGAMRKSWGDGFVYDVTVTNAGDAPLETVQVEIAFDGAIEHLWSGTWQAAGDGTWLVTLDVSNLQPGESATFGFTAEADPATDVTVAAVGAAPAPADTPTDSPDADADTDGGETSELDRKSVV